MRWLGWLLRTKNRRLEISAGGRWYLIFTLLLGVVAINSGNNVIYLLESLLLSSLLFSGVLSEISLARLDVRRITRQAVANEPAADLLLVRNRSWLSFYCVEVGEWRDGTFVPLAFLLRVPKGGELRVRSSQILGERGRYRWDGLALATSFPFGFARKVRTFADPGSRIVWPARAKGEPALLPSGRSDEEPLEGELEEVQPWQDTRRVHWPSSSRSGRLMERPVRFAPESDEVIFPLGGGDQERRMTHASARLQSRARSLLLVGPDGNRRVHGAQLALDTLSLLPREGE